MQSRDKYTDNVLLLLYRQLLHIQYVMYIQLLSIQIYCHVCSTFTSKYVLYNLLDLEQHLFDEWLYMVQYAYKLYKFVCTISCVRQMKKIQNTTYHAIKYITIYYKVPIDSNDKIKSVYVQQCHQLRFKCLGRLLRKANIYLEYIWDIRPG